jgi:hypothetical protein
VEWHGVAFGHIRGNVQHGVRDHTQRLEATSARFTRTISLAFDTTDASVSRTEP